MALLDFGKSSIRGGLWEEMAGSGGELFGFRVPISRVGPTPFHLITTAAAPRLTHFLRHRFIIHRTHLALLFQNLSPLGHMSRLEEVWNERAFHFEGFNFLQSSYGTYSTTYPSCLYFFGGEEIKNNDADIGKSYMDTSRKVSSNGRRLTNIIIAVNVLVYLAQIVTKGKLLLWGAKVNSLIDKGQLWRLATSSLLHANIGHLMVNCYSLNSIGPTVESISGPKRYIAIYVSSAIASAAMSYWLCKAPAVGASGAVFGLVGSFAVFSLRHRSLVKGGMGDLQYIAQVIALNMAIGLMSVGIDNWGHLGGLIVGIATSWLIGPAWKYESISNDGRRVFVDRAPIFSLVKARGIPR